MAEDKTPPILQSFLDFYSGIEAGAKNDFAHILAAFAENLVGLLELDENDFDDPAVSELIGDLKEVVANSKDPAKALAEWFTSKFHNPETMGGCMSDWLNTIMVPNAKRGQALIQLQQDRSEIYSKKRHIEWGKYQPWLNEYFGRNPDHSITDGRKACARKFERSLKTIERRTGGYEKPS